MSDSQLNKLKSATKSYWCNFQIRLSSSVFGTNETNFPHKLLWTVRQLSNLSKASANNLSANIRLSKTQLFEIIQPGGFLGSWLTITFAKSILIPLGLPAVAAAASAAYVGIHKKNLESGTRATILILSNKEIEDIIKVVKSLEYSGLLINGIVKLIDQVLNKDTSAYHYAIYFRQECTCFIRRKQRISITTFVIVTVTLLRIAKSVLVNLVFLVSTLVFF